MHDRKQLESSVVYHLSINKTNWNLKIKKKSYLFISCNGLCQQMKTERYIGN